jgi:DNA-binding transcriptional MerR regulator
MRIGDLAQRSGLGVHTLRYYERIGLIPFADRDRSGRRDYDGSILVWLAFLERLKTTGMPIRERLRYASLRAAGDRTAGARKRLLEAHRERVGAHVAELESCLLVLDAKIAGYAGEEEKHDDQPAGPVPGRKPARARQARALPD